MSSSITTPILPYGPIRPTYDPIRAEKEVMTATNTAAPYTLISSDCHAGGNMKAYEE